MTCPTNPGFDDSRMTDHKVHYAGLTKRAGLNGVWIRMFETWKWNGAPVGSWRWVRHEDVPYGAL